MLSRIALLSLVALATPALAAETYTLTPAQVEAAMRSGAATRSSQGEAAAERPSRQVHGEVGAMIGTGGARGLFGTVLAPIGNDGFAAIAVESSRVGGTPRGWRSQNARPRNSRF